MALLYDYDLTNFNRLAWRCKLRADIVLEDVQNAMRETNESILVLADNDKYGTGTWSIISEDDWMRWWRYFLKQWENKCKSRWREHFKGKNEEITTSKSWIDLFVPLYIEGCFILKHIRIREIKQIIVQISNAPGLNEDERKTWLQWGNILEARLDNMLTKAIASQVELYKQEIEQRVNESGQQGTNTPQAKLQGAMPGKRSWTGKILG